MKFYIKHMVSNRCKMMVKYELEKLGFHMIVVELGSAEILETISGGKLLQFQLALLTSGLELLQDRRCMLIEKIKNCVIDFAHHSSEELKTNFSEYLRNKLEYDYAYMANLFSEVEGITIERFLITHKIERAKELIVYDELNLSEIARKLHYSGLGHLSNQFKQITGLTPSHFKKMKHQRRKLLETI